MPLPYNPKATTITIAVTAIIRIDYNTRNNKFKEMNMGLDHFSKSKEDTCSNLRTIITCSNNKLILSACCMMDNQLISKETVKPPQ